MDSVVAKKIPNHHTLSGQANSLTRLSAFTVINYVKKILLLLFLLTALTKDLSASKSYIELEEIEEIRDVNERAAMWLIYAYVVSVENPKNIASKLAISNKLLPTEYRHRATIRAIIEAEIHKIKGAHGEAIAKTAGAIALLEKVDRPTPSEKKILALSYLAYARFAKYTKDKSGINYGYKALKLANEINFLSGKVFAHNQIGLLISYFNKDFTLALKHFSKAKELLPQALLSVRHFMEGFVLGNIAKTWAELGDIQKSIDYKLALLANEDNIDNVELIMGTHNNLGTNYYDLKKYDLARKHLQITLSIMDQHQIYTNRGIPLYRLGLIELELGNLHLVNAYIDAIDFWLIDHQFIGSYLIDFYQLKSKVAKANTDFEQAMFWLEKASTEQESINQLAKSNNIVKLEEAHKYSTLRAERLLLEKEMKANEVKVQKQRIQLITTSIFVVFGFTYFFIFYRRQKEVTTLKRSTPIIKKVEIPKNKEVDLVLQQKIMDALGKEKLYLNPNLTLKKFADHLDSNTSYVSKTINDGYGKNYSALLNHYRVLEIQRAFLKGEHREYTIESIYKKAGFKSKSAFQKAFKAQTGLTASNYINQLSTAVNVHT
ncbi:MAG: AraC family transcriptional regulator [Bacteroidota bacterium]